MLPSLPRQPGKNQHDTAATLRRTLRITRGRRPSGESCSSTATPRETLCAPSCDVRRPLLAREPSSAETPGQPAPIFLSAIEEVLLEVYSRHPGDQIAQLRDRSRRLRDLAR